MDGNITREGITADLEAMKRVGLAGAVLLDVSQEIPQGPVRFNSHEWQSLFNHAVHEASRFGLQIVLHNGAGWSGSGGPWVTPESAMQKVVWAKTNVVGPGRFNGPLPNFSGHSKSTRDIATLAFPTLVSDGAPVPGFAPKITASIADFASANLLDSNPATFASLPAPKPRKPQYLQLEFQEPFTASILKLSGFQKQSFRGSLQVSDTGRSFRTVREFSDKNGDVSLTLDPVSARFFRLLFTDANPAGTTLTFAELHMAPEYRIQWSQAKTGAGPLPRTTSQSGPTNIPSFELISLGRITNLAEHLDKSGQLDWQVPPGQWTLLRLAYQPIGMSNHPPSKGGEGLECDKLSREAIKSHFDSFLRPLIRNAGITNPRAFSGLFIESWEVGYQNWTPNFREEFQKRRGYDPLKFLPTFTGRFVESAEQSERFLWDVRRTIADLVADNYAGHLAELAHTNGLQLFIEGYGTPNGPLENLQYVSRGDVTMSEFWNEADDFGRFHHSSSMAWAAHTSGKTIVAAEAFSAHAAGARWQSHPYSLKAMGDVAFCAGVNRFVFHRFAHQPWLDREPGMTMGSSGTQYQRTTTWWEQSKAWHEYLARCQCLLQSGLFAADVCYMTSESAYLDPPSKDQLNPPLPSGYYCDVASPEVVLNRMSVTDGRLVLPDGMSYGFLLLPSSETMTPGLLRKIKSLVEAGATVVGPPPRKSPSLANFPACDTEVTKLAFELWGSLDGRTRTENRFSKGRVIWGKHLSQVLAEIAGPPDFEQAAPIPGNKLSWIHRRLADCEVYFVANSNAFPVAVECQFRVSGRQPELWQAETGKIERPALWREDHGRTVLPLSFSPAGSIFVVFAEAGKRPSVVRIVRDGKAEKFVNLTVQDSTHLRLLADKAGTYEIVCMNGNHLKTEVKSLPAPIPIAGPWRVHFPPGKGAPDHIVIDQLASWSKHELPGVRYFSGTATYSNSFRLPKEYFGSSSRIFLDLGKVEVIAELKVNGHDLGTWWKPPFEADITEAVTVGQNSLAVEVVNLWPNRLIGDEQLPDDCEWKGPWSGSGMPLAAWPRWLQEGKTSPSGRITFATWKHWQKDSPLIDSGLLGPVSLRVAQEHNFEP